MRTGAVIVVDQCLKLSTPTRILIDPDQQEKNYLCIRCMTLTAKAQRTCTAHEELDTDKVTGIAACENSST
jgi:hypothetical protein